jgi:hypothetical protein
LGATQTVACTADHEFYLDRNGRYTLAISTQADRPTNAINWLPLGDVYDSWVYMRQFLADPSYQQAAIQVRPGQNPAAVMGPYFPISGYCSTAAFEAKAAACLTQQ